MGHEEELVRKLSSAARGGCLRNGATMKTNQEINEIKLNAGENF